MLWNKVLQVIFGSGTVLAATISPSVVAPPGVDELLTYECARAVATMVDRSEQLGPVFAQGNLVFSSVSTTDGSRVLIVNAGAGTYAIPLEKAGLNRIRFEIPTLQSAQAQVFFITYLHDPAYRSRVFEFSVQRAPVGKEELDYSLVMAQRAPYLLPNLEYAIWETTEANLNAVTDGFLKRDRLSTQKADCAHLDRKSPTLARGLRRNLDVLEFMAVSPPPTHSMARLPASASPAR